ncbi:DUF58 domain-containing protein [Cytophagaceae bacterium 50C-KIRBA]|uniref:DUF58 domain-containing protein n=1 Tax=Aquirufa beregesia TaxID=2516556 RepID=A0ABX0EUU5_9BACT|nr:DUF58 domain-containing protein [Aquirufa beregesia]
MHSFLSHVVQLEIRIRKAINTQMHGNFSSIFKGSGLEFSDLRQYHYGDDVRHIDWNTTAKGHGTFVKLFKEEKEQTVFFLMDVSASQQVGRNSQSKLKTLKEVAGVLSFSAMQEASHLGFCGFSDKNEKFMPPAIGKKHAYRVITELFKMNPESTGTDLKAALGFTLQVLKRRSLIFVLSDFIDENYHDLLRAMSQMHDLVVIQILDKQEIKLPSLGIIPIFDPERKRTTWVNTSSKFFKNLQKEQGSQRAEELKKLCKQWQADYISIRAGEDFVPTLVKLFTVRK